MNEAALEIAWCSAIGALLLAVCAIPQAIEARRNPLSTRGLSWLFLTAWGFGELFMFAGLLPIASWPVLANYVVNVLLISYISGVKYANRATPF